MAPNKHPSYSPRGRHHNPHPPAPNHSSLSMSLSFEEDMSMQEDGDENHGLHSPPRRNRATANTNTPKQQTRRLFGAGGGQSKSTAPHSPFPLAGAGGGAPRSWQSSRQQNSQQEQLNDSSTTEDGSTCSMLSAGSASTAPPPGNNNGGARKRSSGERRGGTLDQQQYMSPRISPNSFLTMDGRFVQSKNPFSSPMMTDTPIPSDGVGAAVGAAQAALAPAIPTQFYNSLSSNNNNNTDGSGAPPKNSGDGDDDDDTKMPPSFLPPRHKHTTGNLHHHPHRLQPKQGTPVTLAATDLQAFTLGNSESGYLDPASKFTGSPIPEHNHYLAPAATGRAPPPPYCYYNNNNGSAAAAAVTLHHNDDTATHGSLRKVRRINRTDDVVAATGHHLSRLTTNDSGASLSSDTTMRMGGNNNNDDPFDDDDISPTDVSHFPSFAAKTPASKKAPPPTPIKQRLSHQPYGRRHNHNYNTRTTPGPPVLTRKGAVRTPHPGSYMNHMHNAPHHSHDEEDNDENPNHCTTGKSRFYSDFDVIGELGKGSFGTVFKVLSRLDGCMYAIKAAQRQAKGAADRGRMLKEVYALAALSDQADTANFHIVRYHQAWMEDDRLYIQTELCSGTLGDEMARVGPLTSPRRYKLLREMLLALDFIHRNNMVHLDIKPENIFLKNDQYKLGDFGLVTKVSSEQEIEEGDSRYMSMELLSGDRSDLTKSDIFSLGATMYEVCLGRPLPMNGPEWQDIRAGRLSPLPMDDDHDMASIVQRMMDPVAAHRPTPSELLQHPQLLSDEQKALHAEKTKVRQANLQLAAQLVPPPPPTRRPLQRANTWSGTSLPAYW